VGTAALGCPAAQPHRAASLCVGRTLLPNAFDFDRDLAEDQQNMCSTVCITVKEQRFSAAITAEVAVRGSARTDFFPSRHTAGEIGSGRARVHTCRIRLAGERLQPLRFALEAYSFPQSASNLFCNLLHPPSGAGFLSSSLTHACFSKRSTNIAARAIRNPRTSIGSHFSRSGRTKCPTGHFTIARRFSAG
jgi:hypothetical protein